jgi:hypothetical protein
MYGPSLEIERFVCGQWVAPWPNYFPLRPRQVESPPGLSASSSKPDDLLDPAPEKLVTVYEGPRHCMTRHRSCPSRPPLWTWPRFPKLLHAVVFSRSGDVQKPSAVLGLFSPGFVCTSQLGGTVSSSYSHSTPSFAWSSPYRSYLSTGSRRGSPLAPSDGMSITTHSIPATLLAAIPPLSHPIHPKRLEHRFFRRPRTSERI